MNNEKKSKNLFLVSYTFPYHAGGGLNALSFAEFLNSQGNNTKILTFSRNLKLPIFSFINRTKIIRIPYFNKGVILKMFSLVIILPVYFIQAIKSETIIIYGSYIIAWELMVIFGWILKKRVIFRSTMYGEDDIESILSYKKLLFHLRKFALARIQNYFSLTPLFTQSYLKCGYDKNKIIQSSQGVDIEKFCPVSEINKSKLRLKLGMPEKVLIIISIGTLTCRKGYINIFKELELLTFPFQYFVMGDILLKGESDIRHIEATSDKIIENGMKLLADKVKFKGFVDNIEEYLQAADVFLMASEKEGLPNALLEAMACGLTILANKINKIDEYLLMDKKNCLLVDEKNSISKQLIRLSNRPELFEILGKEATNTTIKYHSYKTVASSLILKGFTNV